MADETTPKPPGWLIWVRRAAAVFDTVVLGVMAAIPLAWIAWGVSKLGWSSFPVFALAPFCAFIVGRHTALRSSLRDLDRKLAELDERYPPE